MASKEVDTTLSQNLGFVTNKFGQPVLNEQGDMTPYGIKQTEEQKAQIKNEQFKALLSQGYDPAKAFEQAYGNNA
jgi:hypothetical protein